MQQAIRSIRGGTPLLCVLGALGLAGAFGCASTETPAARKTVLEPLKWVVEDRLLALRFDRLGDSDVVEPACDSSGVLSLSPVGGAGTLRSSPAICRALFNGTAFDLSADGTTLFYADGSQDGRIMRLHLDSGRSEVVLADSCLIVPGPLAANWSHGEIAVGRNCASNDAGGLWLVRLVDGAMRPFLEGSEDRRFGGMSWDNEGRRLVLDLESSSAAIHSIVVASRDDTVVTELGSGRNPAWSPSGLDIALIKESEEDSFRELQTVTVRTGARRVLVSSDPRQRGATRWAPAISGPLVWSPGGTRIAFSDDCGIAIASLTGEKLEWVAAGGTTIPTRCR